MAEFEEKLNEILSSPEAMEQIMALANSLSAADHPSETSDAQGTAPEEPSAAPEPGSGALGELLGQMDAGTMGRLVSLLGEYRRGEDEKTQLLAALRPFLRPERREKLEWAIQITRLSRVIRSALGLFKGGEDV